MKFLLFFLLFACIVTFLFIYFYELYHNNEQVPYKLKEETIMHSNMDVKDTPISEPDYEELGRGS